LPAAIPAPAGPAENAAEPGGGADAPAAAAGISAPVSGGHPLDVGDSFVDFGLPELDLGTGTPGRIVWLSDFVGDGVRTTPKRLLLLNFFATWCTPCFTELALLNEWQRAYGEQGLQVVSVNVRLPDENAEQSMLETRALLNGLKVVFPLLFERYTQRNQVAYLGARATLPSNLLIGADGSVLFRTEGARASELTELEQQVRAVLGVEAGAAPPAHSNGTEQTGTCPPAPAASP
jgi:thiol-disulfide isomerase/thioredoxin